MIEFELNGRAVSLDIDPETPLLWALRDDLKMTGVKYGCGIAACGACTVYWDGSPVRACQTLISDVEGAEITTIEGLGGAEGAAVQAAWRELDVAQCGYCQSGQIMAAAALLKDTPRPTDEEITLAMEGNVCRCATYVRVRAAIHRASEILNA